MEIGIKDIYAAQDDDFNDGPPSKEDKPLKTVAKGTKNKDKKPAVTKFGMRAVDLSDPLNTRK
jgi:hypothetical protein